MKIPRSYDFEKEAMANEEEIQQTGWKNSQDDTGVCLAVSMVVGSVGNGAVPYQGMVEEVYADERLTYTVGNSTYEYVVNEGGRHVRLLSIREVIQRLVFLMKLMGRV